MDKTVEELLTYKQRGTDNYFPPLKYWTTNNGTHIAIYQGFRGENPDLDFIVKYRSQGQRLRTPSHTHWIVDLLVKCEYNKHQVMYYVNYLLDLYENMEPFQTVEERDNYQMKYVSEAVEHFGDLDGHGYYTIEVLTSFIELFIRCEKQTSGAFMFKNLLQLVKDYCEGKKDFYQVVGYSKRV